VYETEYDCISAVNTYVPTVKYAPLLLDSNISNEVMLPVHVAVIELDVNLDINGLLIFYNIR
jgi:hypothetical protein